MDNLILNFSSRREGNCYHLARLAGKMLPGETEIVDFCDLDVRPCGKCGYECFRGGACPLAEDGIPSVYEKIAAAGQVIFIAPNYCGYPCGNFFAFNERGCSYFGGRRDRLEQFLSVPKRFIVVSNSESHHFSEAFGYLAREKEPRMLYLGTRKYGLTSFQGNLAEAPGVEDAVKQFLLG